MARSKDVAKKAGIAYGVKKVLGGVTKLALIGTVSAAAMKVLRKDKAGSSA